VGSAAEIHGLKCDTKAWLALEKSCNRGRLHSMTTFWRVQRTLRKRFPYRITLEQDEAVTLALRRLRDEGLLEREGQGRATQWVRIADPAE